MVLAFRTILWSYQNVSQIAHRLNVILSFSHLLPLEWKFVKLQGRILLIHLLLLRFHQLAFKHLLQLILFHYHYQHQYSNLIPQRLQFHLLQQPSYHFLHLAELFLLLLPHPAFLSKLFQLLLFPSFQLLLLTLGQLTHH